MGNGNWIYTEDGVCAMHFWQKQRCRFLPQWISVNSTQRLITPTMQSTEYHWSGVISRHSSIQICSGIIRDAQIHQLMLRFVWRSGALSTAIGLKEHKRAFTSNSGQWQVCLLWWLCTGTVQLFFFMIENFSIRYPSNDHWHITTEKKFQKKTED